MKLSISCFKFKRGGGSERYVLDLINGFYQKGIKPTVYSTSFDKSVDEYQKIIPKKASLSFIPKKLRLPFLSKFIQKKVQADEVVFSMTHTYSDITICGGQHKGYLKSLNQQPTLLEKFKIWNEQKSFDNAKHIIAHSALMKKELMELYHIPDNKISVIYPPANTTLFTPISDEERIKLRKKFGFSQNEIIYLFPSTGHRRKGFYWLKSFFENSDLPIKLVVAGTPVKESKNIISLGFRNDMPDLYRAADFTIMASSYEPFGLVGIESILSGTPVIFADNMACTETFKDNFGFVFNLQQPEKFPDILKQSVEYIQNGKGRIASPKSTLSYCPELSTHIELLLQQAQSVLQRYKRD